MSVYPNCRQFPYNFNGLSGNYSGNSVTNESGWYIWAVKNCRFILLLFSLVAFPGLFQKSVAQYVEGDKTLPASTRRDSIIVKDHDPEETGFQSSKLVPGGNLALQFGNPYYYDISPSLGYMVTEKLMVGLGVIYVSMGGRDPIYNQKYNFTYYGGRPLIRYKVINDIYANAEIDFLNSPYNYATNYTIGEKPRKWTTNPLLGASYVIPFGKRGGVQATLLYNLNYQEDYSPYSSAFIWRIGFFL